MVLGVSIDVDGDAYHRFLKQPGINFLTVRDPEQKVPAMYGTIWMAGDLHHRSPGCPAPEIRRRRRLDSPEVMDFLNKL